MEWSEMNTYKIPSSSEITNGSILEHRAPDSRCPGCRLVSNRIVIQSNCIKYLF